MKLTPPKVLIVDDQPANLFALRRLLNKVKVEVIEADNGNDALARTVEHDLALILLDAQMPEMDGYEVAALLRSNDDTRHIPIIFVTAAYKDDPHRLRGYGAGAVDYIEKPIDDAILLSKVRVFIELYERKRELGRMLALVEGTNRHLTTEIAERKAAEEALRQAKAAAEAANRAKSAFLANMSHELRTPLNAILGFAQVLAGDPGLGGVRQRAVANIASNGEHLLLLIEDILDLARIEAGRFEITPAPCDLAYLFTTLRSPFALQAEQRGIRLDFAALTPLPAVQADERRLRQIVMNLLSNAIRFTERGGVRISLAYRDGTLGMEVADTGVGIPPERMDAIFQPFRQAMEEPYKQQEKGPGLGLGLAITRGLVEQMGGTITVQSQVGEGTLFRVEIPLPRALGLPARHLPPGDVEDMGIAPDLGSDEPPPSTARVPPGLLDGLDRAIMVGGSRAIESALAAIEPHDPSLAALLRRWVADYQYDRVNRLLHDPSGERNE